MLERISSVLKYIAENMIPDSDEKAYLLEITNFCTHEPFIMTATDKSLDYKYKRLLKLLRYENASEEVRENLAKKALNVAREAMMSLTY